MPNWIDNGAKLVLEIKQHAEDALARVPRYLSEKAKFLAVLSAFVEKADEVEAALQDVLNDRTLAAAVGDQLDQLGSIVGQERAGLDDETYRTIIRARVLVNRSSGSIPNLVAIFALVAVEPVVVRDRGNAHVVVDLTRAAQNPDLILIFVEFLREARAAGVRGLLEFSTRPIGESFRYTSGPGYNQGHYAGVRES